MYSFDSRIRYSEVDGEGLLRPDALVNYFQDCSTFQSEDGDVGLAYMKQRGIAWIVNYWQIDAENWPVLRDRVTVGTNPYELKGFVGIRNFYLDDAQGKRMVTANSVWSLMDLVNMRPVRITEEMSRAYATAEKLPMDYQPRKIRIPEGESRDCGTITVGEIHLDSNHHLNNAQYIRFLMDLIPGDAIPERIRIEYRKQAFLGDEIHLVVTEAPAEGNTAQEKVIAAPESGTAQGNRDLFISMQNAEGAVFAASEMILRKRRPEEINAWRI